MFRLLIFLAALALAAWGLSWLADNPGRGDADLAGHEYQVSLILALGAVVALALALSIVWALLQLRFSRPLAGFALLAGAQAREGFPGARRAA